MGRRGSHRLRIRRRFSEKALITFPFHDPPPDRAMTVANEVRVEHRRAPRRRRRHEAASGGECAARTIHRVSAVEGAGCRRHPQQQRGDAGGLRCEREFSAGDEIELARLAPHFQHDSADRIAGERVGGGAQGGLGIGGAHGDDQPRIEAEFAKPAHRQRAGFEFGKILPHPDQRLCAARSAPRGLRQNRSPPRPDVPRQTLHARQPPRARRAASHPRSHGQARPC